MTDIAAAIGREQLKKASMFLEDRKKIANFYFRELGYLDFLRLPEKVDNHAWHLFMPRIVDKKLTITRNEFINKLVSQGIGISVHYIPLHIMPYYQKKYGFKPHDFPKTLKAYNSIFSLPIYPGLTDEQLERIVSAVKNTGLQYWRKH